MYSSGSLKRRSDSLIGALTSSLPVAKDFLDRAGAHGLQVFYGLNGFYSFPPYNESRGTNSRGRVCH
jgi:hypothetical protein